jgi:hypothetical protein
VRIDVWIITNGYNLGVVQYVGQAINKVRIRKPEKDIVAIGICKWGSVKDVGNLTGLNKTVHPIQVYRYSCVKYQNIYFTF